MLMFIFLQMHRTNSSKGVHQFKNVDDTCCVMLGQNC
jgi:hypothetical protein